jgi:nucleoside-diphosphate-sugar epimerase
VTKTRRSRGTIGAALCVGRDAAGVALWELAVGKVEVPGPWVVIDRESSTSHHLYNLGNSDPIELRQLVAAIAQALGKTPVIQHLPDQPGDVRQTYADIARAATELGYAPKTPIAEGSAQYIAWYRATES